MVIVGLILNEEILSILVQVWCEGENTPKEEYWRS